MVSIMVPMESPHPERENNFKDEASNGLSTLIEIAQEFGGEMT